MKMKGLICFSKRIQDDDDVVLDLYVVSVCIYLGTELLHLGRLGIDLALCAT